MKAHVVFACLVLGSILALPRASIAHDRGEPAEFPRWRGTPELTVYFPQAPRTGPVFRASPAGVGPAATRPTLPPRNC